MGEPNNRVRPTRDEALADALSMCGPGDRITIHSETCANAEEWERGGDCRCTPLVLKIGATA